MKRFDLSNRSALVTGSTKGIGRGIAVALLECNARVLFHGRSRPDDLAPEHPCLLADLLEPEAARALVAQAFEVAPNLDILVCNAGSFFDTPFLEMTPENYDKTLDLNVRAPYFLIQAFTQRLVAENRPGSVVIVGSTNGYQAEYDSTAYDTSKGALVMLTKTLALSLGDKGIRVNCMAPGLIYTPLTNTWLQSDHVARAHYEKNTPLGRIGNIEDCGAATAFLVSDAAAYITGHVLVIDGGLTLSQIDKA